MPVFDVYDDQIPRRVVIATGNKTSKKPLENASLANIENADPVSDETYVDSPQISRQALSQESLVSISPDQPPFDLTESLFNGSYRVTIGRTGDNDIILHEKRASRRHCEVSYEPEKGFVLSDLVSRNGTYLNQCLIENQCPINNGDEIGIGKSAIRFWIDLDKIHTETPKLPIVRK